MFFVYVLHRLVGYNQRGYERAQDLLHVSNRNRLRPGWNEHRHNWLRNYVDQAPFTTWSCGRHVQSPWEIVHACHAPRR